MSNLNAVYTERNKLIALAARQAIALGYTAGVSRDEAEPSERQNTVFIDLPSGQVAWHLHESEMSWFSFLSSYSKPWDGHTTEEKYDRVLKAVYPAPLANPAVNGGSIPIAPVVDLNEVGVYVENCGVAL